MIIHCIVLVVAALLPLSTRVASFLSEVDLHNQGNNVSDIVALIQKKAEFPCDMGSDTPGDKPLLLLWYRGLGSSLQPIYSYDLRNMPMNMGIHWSEDQLRLHLKVQPSSTVAVLTIRNVKDSDQSIYRCHVDFSNSQSRHYFFNLTVIIPPPKPVILDNRGNFLGSVAGPLAEGDDLELTCKVTGGRPKPTVVWVRDGKVMDALSVATAETTGAQNRVTIVSTTHLRVLDRSALHSTFICQASNNNISLPSSAEITIDLDLPPISLTMEIIGSPKTLSAGQKPYQALCQVVGSRPPPAISWSIGDDVLRDFESRQSGDGNLTTSILTLVPLRSHDGKRLKCSAWNKKIKGKSPLESSVRLNVTYPPDTVIKIAQAPNPNFIAEGDTVVLSCDGKANPPITNVSWKFQGAELPDTLARKVTRTSRTLQLMGVTRQADGLFQCLAWNQEGSHKSTFRLPVRYRPKCGNNTRVYWAALHETVNVTCEVDSDPMPDSFRWAYNGTKNLISVPMEQVSVSQYRSILPYTPVSEMDFGDLICSAKNKLGMQQEPCVFSIFHAERPDPVHNCSVTRMGAGTLSIECIAGNDNGMKQTYKMVVLNSTGKSVQRGAAPLASNVPQFRVDGLESKDNYTLVIYATNPKGNSDNLSIPLSMSALPIPSPSPAPLAEARWYLMLQTLLGLFFGTVVTVGLVAFACCYFGRTRRERSTSSGNRQEKVNSTGAAVYSNENERSAGKYSYHQQSYDSTKDSSAVHCSGSITISSKEDALLIDQDQDPDVIPVGRRKVHLMDFLSGNDDSQCGVPGNNGRQISTTRAGALWTRDDNKTGFESPKSGVGGDTKGSDRENSMNNAARPQDAPWVLQRSQSIPEGTILQYVEGRFLDGVQAVGQTFVGPSTAVTGPTGAAMSQPSVIASQPPYATVGRPLSKRRVNFLLQPMTMEDQAGQQVLRVEPSVQMPFGGSMTQTLGRTPNRRCPAHDAFRDPAVTMNATPPAPDPFDLKLSQLHEIKPCLKRANSFKCDRMESAV